MKRILSGFFILLTLALTACGSPNSDPPGASLPSSLTTDPAAAVQTTSAGTSASADTTADTAAAPGTTESPTAGETAATGTEPTAETTAAAAAATTATAAQTTVTAAATATSAASAATTAQATTGTDEAETPVGGKAIILYFSCTGTTRAAAERIAALCDADLLEILPETPYTAADLNYNDDSCRANREMNDPDARPAIAGDRIDLTGYDTVFLGYPIWWGTMPRIINTFLDTYDLSGKVVLPFCTSGSSGISTSVSAIRDAEPDADVRDGLRISGTRGIDTWLENNAVPVKAD